MSTFEEWKDARFSKLFHNVSREEIYKNNPEFFRGAGNLNTVATNFTLEQAKAWISTLPRTNIAAQPSEQQKPQPQKPSFAVHRDIFRLFSKKQTPATDEDTPKNKPPTGPTKGMG